MRGTLRAEWPSEVKIDTSAFVAALKNAAKNAKVTFREERVDGYNEYTINWNTSTIEIESLRTWLYVRNYDNEFFITKPDEKEKLLDNTGEFYAPKLAAAVRAWNEVTADPKTWAGKSPKKALEIWLRKHANEYGLTGKDGNPNKLGIEEICKVANWKPNGGASPTPSLPNPPTVFGKPPVGAGEFGRRDKPKPPTPSTLDDDIPF